ncbi:UNC-like C-terminal-domain-containing protein [Zychaea mexicana]|uniref:UNC-like C-terminal-domain-containing protein n=1 Tax=Zychaea mexicana TaxID=64656 RepID=UPI0022FE00D1|nr:UNC-like C-terminal-domain-containing protein [Zychaea mexicana]KAI9496256.1 UNC-like C-terminal-domain-containing protein [Zychaea mexicana]
MHPICIYILAFYPLYTASTLIPFTIASHSHDSHHRRNSNNRYKIDKRQCLRFRENDVLLDMCPAFEQSDLDSFQALFPDVSILSGLGHDADFNLLYPPMLLDSSSHSHQYQQQQRQRLDSIGNNNDPTAIHEGAAELATLERTHEQQRANNEPSSSLIKDQPRGDASSTPAVSTNHENQQKYTTSNMAAAGSSSSSFSSSSYSTSSTQQHTAQQQSASSNGDSSGNNNRNGGGLLLSFEELQQRVLQKENNDRWTSNSNRKRGGGGNLGQIIDSVDGDFADDFGSMFEARQGPPAANVYDEEEYIEPSRAAGGSANSHIPGNNNNQNQQQQQPKSSRIASVPIKSLKERFNYASIDCAATVRGANKEAKGAQSIVYESKDQYMLNKCSADKYVIINLCEPVLIDTIVMANFEFFSSTFSEFRVYVADRYPTKDWKLLGQWQARNTRDLQVFKVNNRFGWFENIKIEFLNHYGHEYYCPLSLVRVHGMTMMEYYYLVERRAGDDEDYEIEDEILWPSEVRNEIIHPNIDTVNDTMPIIPEQEDDTSDDHEQAAVILPVNDEDDDENYIDNNINDNIEAATNPVFSTPIAGALPDDLEKEGEQPTVGIVEKLTLADNEASSSDISSSSSTSLVIPSAVTTDTPSILPTDAVTSESQNEMSSSLASPASFSSNHTSVTVVPSDPTMTRDSTILPTDDILYKESSVEEQSTPAASLSVNENEENLMNHTTTSTTSAIASTTTGNSGSNSGTTMTTNVGSLLNTAINNSAQATSRVMPKPSNMYKDSSYTQESIYKTIMKRLNALELNATLSQRYLDEQNKMLNDVFMSMEKRHQDQIVLLLGRLNDTASTRIDGMKRRYEQAYDELQQMTENNMKEMTAKMALLADQIAFERRVSMAQLVIVVMLFVFVALSRGTLSILSPIMEAQAQERKRRESADAQAILETAPSPRKTPTPPPVVAITPESLPTSPREDERPRANSLFRDTIPKPRRRWSDNGDGNSTLEVEATFANDSSLRFLRRRKSSSDAAIVPEL